VAVAASVLQRDRRRELKGEAGSGRISYPQVGLTLVEALAPGEGRSPLALLPGRHRVLGRPRFWNKREVARALALARGARLLIVPSTFHPFRGRAPPGAAPRRGRPPLALALAVHLQAERGGPPSPTLRLERCPPLAALHPAACLGAWHPGAPGPLAETARGPRGPEDEWPPPLDGAAWGRTGVGAAGGGVAQPGFCRNPQFLLRAAGAAGAAGVKVVVVLEQETCCSSPDPVVHPAPLTLLPPPLPPGAPGRARV